MTRISLRAIVCFLSIFLSACGTLDAMKYCGAAWFICALPMPEADRECADEPQYTPPPSVRSRTIAIFNQEALSWLAPQRYKHYQGIFSILEIEQLVQVLSSTQFESIELKVPPRNGYSRDWQTSELFLESTATPEWVRISLQPAGHRLCKGFETAARKGRFSLERLKEEGLPAGKCMAVEPITSPESTFAFDIVERSDSTSSEYRYAWRVEDLKTKSTYAEIVHHLGSGRDCPSDLVRKNFVNIVQP
ncbi:hypothetical protein [Chromobacterium violaceum]|uniref:hypothetical protein n=1 Tax=Chromobacterium violaceum TaxID=536 RepID=UPI0012D3B060|nr:hypothetical protein [Chromobacterium violaceum]